MEKIVDRAIGVLAIAALVAGEALGWGLSSLVTGALLFMAGVSTPSVGTMIAGVRKPAE